VLVFDQPLRDDRQFLVIGRIGEMQRPGAGDGPRMGCDQRARGPFRQDSRQPVFVVDPRRFDPARRSQCIAIRGRPQPEVVVRPRGHAEQVAPAIAVAARLDHQRRVFERWAAKVEKAARCSKTVQVGGVAARGGVAREDRQRALDACGQCRPSRPVYTRRRCHGDFHSRGPFAEFLAAKRCREARVGVFQIADFSTSFCGVGFNSCPLPHGRGSVDIPDSLWYYPYRAAMGMRRPLPKALDVTFRPVAACLRLYSLTSTSRATLATVSRSKPRSTIRATDASSST
jgi:hypothetical protein